MKNLKKMDIISKKNFENHKEKEINENGKRKSIRKSECKKSFVKK